MTEKAFKFLLQELDKITTLEKENFGKLIEKVHKDTGETVEYWDIFYAGFLAGEKTAYIKLSFKGENDAA